jgi:hypothetical protein
VFIFPREIFGEASKHQVDVPHRGSGVLTREFHAPEPVMVSGVVIDATDETPISDATVCLYSLPIDFEIDLHSKSDIIAYESKKARLGFFLTGTDGRIAAKIFADPLKLKLLADASAQGYAKGGARIKWSGAAPEEVLIRLAPQAIIRGRVLDPDGNPVAGARVSSRFDGAQIKDAGNRGLKLLFPSAAAVDSDANGILEVPFAPQAKDSVMFLQIQAGGLSANDTVEIPANEKLVERTWRLAGAGLELYVMVVGPNDEPIAGAPVSVLDSRQSQVSYQKETDREGIAAFTGLAQSTLVLRVPGAQDAMAIVTPETSPVSKVIMLEPRIFTGVVLDEYDERIAGVSAIPLKRDAEGDLSLFPVAGVSNEHG